MDSLIDSLNLWGERSLSLAWPLLWQSSLLIALLLALDLAFRRRIRAAIRYALWLVLLVKLVLPPSLALPTGVAWWLPSTKPAPAPKPQPNFVVTYGNTPARRPSPVVVTPYIPPPPTLAAEGWALVDLGWSWFGVAGLVGRPLATGHARHSPRGASRTAAGGFARDDTTRGGFALARPLAVDGALDVARRLRLDPSGDSAAARPR